MDTETITREISEIHRQQCSGQCVHACSSLLTIPFTSIAYNKMHLSAFQE